MKDILITGAYGGMGLATARELARQGFRVFALDRKVGESEQNVIPIKADITSEESVCAAVEAVRGYTDSLCAIVHFAGIYIESDMEFISFKYGLLTFYHIFT